MHRSRGTFPVSGGRPPRRGRGAASAKGRASSGLPATPKALHLTEAFRAGVRHSSRFATAAATPADDGDDKDHGGESRAQAIQCTYSSLKPMPCQREGCNALVHHLCQGAWERQEGYEDTVACLCCMHHPDYKYEGVPLKVSFAVANAHDVMSKAKFVNVESQVTTESINFANEDLEESSKADGSDDSHDDPAWVDPISGGGMGEGIDDNVSPREHILLPFEITDYYTSDSYDIHERTAHFMVQNHIDGKGEDDFDQTAHDLLLELPLMKKRCILGADTNSEISNLNNSQTTKSNN